MLSFCLFGGVWLMYCIYNTFVWKNVSRDMLVKLIDDDDVANYMENLNNESVNNVCLGFADILNGVEINYELYFEEEELLLRYLSDKFSNRVLKPKED